MPTATPSLGSPVEVKVTPGKVTVNAAFLQAIKETNEELWRLLEGIDYLCAHSSSLRLHAHRLVEMLDRLQDELALHFALEDLCGYFENPVRVAPHLARQAESMRAEHDGLYIQISQIAAQAVVLWYHGQIERLVDSISVRFRAFHDQLKQHESREDDLILNVFADNQELFERLQLSSDEDLVDWAVKSLPSYQLDGDFHRRVLGEIELHTAENAWR